MTFFPAKTSSETQGQIKGARESLNGPKNIYGTKKRKERRVKQKFSGTNQKPERRRPFGTGLVRHCPQGLFSLFFTFLRAIFFRPFRLSLVPTICPWVSEDAAKIAQCEMYKSLVSLHLAILFVFFCCFFFFYRGRRFAAMQLNVKFLRKEEKLPQNDW